MAPAWIDVPTATRRIVPGTFWGSNGHPAVPAELLLLVVDVAEYTDRHSGNDRGTALAAEQTALRVVVAVLTTHHELNRPFACDISKVTHDDERYRTAAPHAMACLDRKPTPHHD